MKSQKRYLIHILVGILLLGAVAYTEPCKLYAAGQEESEFIDPYVDYYIHNGYLKDNIINEIANVQEFTGQEIETVMTDTEKPRIGMVAVNELTDVAGYMELCQQQKVLPVFNVTSETEADQVLQAMDVTNCVDVTIVSQDKAVLSYIREKKNVIRTGLEIEIDKTEITSDEANEIRKAVRSAPATFCVITSENATRQVVAELQELAIAVWVRVQAKAESRDFRTEAVKALTSGANGIISADAGEVTNIMEECFEANTMTRTPIVIGHRGNPTQALENSLSGFLTAYENGADIIELDIGFTKDDEVVIMHDDSIARTTNYSGDLTVGEMTLAEIREYYLVTDEKDETSVTEEKVPTLAEVLEVFQDLDCRIFIELKSTDNPKDAYLAAALVTGYGMDDRVSFISFNSEMLVNVQEAIPGISTGCLMSMESSTGTMDDAIESIYRTLISAQEINSTINPSQSGVNLLVLQAATERGMTIWPWTYYEGISNFAFLECADGMTTDDAQWTKDMSKYITADVYEADITAGDSINIDIASVTYGGTVNTISSEQLIIKIIDGENCVKVKDGKIKGVMGGNATVIFGYKAETTDGSEYVLYTQPVTIKIHINVPMCIAIVVAISVIIGVVAFAVMHTKKNKNMKIIPEEGTKKGHRR